ncbi:hypothetical protein T10_6686 [Trichinella papuae]|uniref:Uncharacterized protein n=1 Tax=Trichinella papuae TaxID=268474 RepID=A0A0V1LYT3_9BILA|nr:hypothetical protein T10_6686 [Trichinella papuae]
MIFIKNGPTQDLMLTITFSLEFMQIRWIFLDIWMILSQNIPTHDLILIITIKPEFVQI